MTDVNFFRVPLYGPSYTVQSTTMDLAEDEIARQRAVVRARDYHDGRHYVKLTDRLREFLRDRPGIEDYDALRFNVTRTVVHAVTERLMVRGFICDDAEQADWAMRVWEQNMGDVMADELHEATIRDGEAFVTVTWDNADQRPRFVPHIRYTDRSIHNGEGIGCRAFYKNDDPSEPLEYVTRRWYETIVENDLRTIRHRLTVYYPDRVEKYLMGNSLQKVRDPGDESWPIKWVDNQGRPLGVPVIHTMNEGLRCEAWDAIPLQNAINKNLVDMLAAGDLTAFQIYTAFGFYPTTDGKPLADDRSNQVKLEPGIIIGSERSAGEATFRSLSGADPEIMIKPITQLVYWVAMVTDTPITRFLVSGQVAAEGTLKQQDGPLLTKVRKRQQMLGSAYESMFAMARKLSNIYGGTSYNEDVPIRVIWDTAETRDDDRMIERAERKMKLGVPRRQLLKELGYSDAQLNTWRIPETDEPVVAMDNSSSDSPDEPDDDDMEVPNA